MLALEVQMCDVKYMAYNSGPRLSVHQIFEHMLSFLAVRDVLRRKAAPERTLTGRVEQLLWCQQAQLLQLQNDIDGVPAGS